MNRQLLAILGLGVIALAVGVGTVLLSTPSGDGTPTATSGKTAKASKRKKRRKKRKRNRKKPVFDENRPPNVLVILWDTVRADRMSLYGHDKPTTPGLEAFARDAVVFENAISPGTWTLPSHASLFTGLPTSSHGAVANWRWVDHHHVTLAEQLQRNGYKTYSYAANPYLSGMTNLLQGFDVRRVSWDDDKAKAAEATRSKLIPRDQSTEISPGYRGKHRNVAWENSPFKDAATLANANLTKWLRKRPNKDKPWFAFVNLMEAHTPRIPTMKARQQVADAETIELGLSTDLSLWNEVSAILGEKTYTREELAAVRAVYDASIVELDLAFTSLMAQLKGAGALDRTIVVLTSDHGENLGDHGLFEHRYAVYQSLVHVPLVIRYPEGLEPRRVREPVSTAAIYPTILELTGVEPPPDVPLLPSLTQPPQGPVFTQLLDPYTSKLNPFRKAYPNADFSRFVNTYDAIVDGTMKAIHSSAGQHELYDLHNDPHETQNLYPNHPKARSMVEAVKAWKARVPKADPSKRVPGDQKKGRGSVQEQRAMTQMLETLGYVEGSE